MKSIVAWPRVRLDRGTPTAFARLQIVPDLEPFLRERYAMLADQMR
jgi:hypothetical protein